MMTQLSDTTVVAQPVVSQVASPVHVRTERAVKQWIDPSLAAPPEYIEHYVPPVRTSIIDSIAADTLSPHILTEEQAEQLKVEHWADSVVRAHEYAEAHAGRNAGIPPEALPPSYSHSTPLAALLAGMLVLAGLSSSGIGRALKAYRNDLVSVRRRANAFDDYHKAPLRSAIILAMIFIVFGGIPLYDIASGGTDGIPVVGVLVSMGVLACYYVFQLCAYSVVGYAFARPDSRRMWLGGFAASQAFAGILLIVPSLLMVFVPQWRTVLALVCATVYGVSRLVFIWKGIRIFYTGFRSLSYFILYLCTLEIIPLFATYSLVNWIIGYVAK